MILLRRCLECLKNYFHLLGLQKSLVAPPLGIFSVAPLVNFFFRLQLLHSNTTLLVYGDMTWTLLAATIDSLDELRKCIKSAFLLSPPPAQSCWTVVDSTKSVSAELSDFGL
jgi:hypothetical protein